MPTSPTLPTPNSLNPQPPDAQLGNQLATQLAKLKDIHYPDPISWFPPAIGWWIVLVLLIIIVVLIIWIYRSRRTVNKQIDYLMSLERQQRPIAIMKQLKAKALKHNHQQVLRLQGKAWRQWLEQQQAAPLSEEWQQWFDQDYLKNTLPPKNWPQVIRSLLEAIT